MELTLAEMPADALRPPTSRRSRRRARLVRFLVCEFFAVTAMLLCGKLAVAERFLNPAYNALCQTLLILSAAVVAILPVLFYGLPRRLSRRTR